MGVVFSLAAGKIGDEVDDLLLCSLEAARCLQAVFVLPRLPAALSVFETLVSTQHMLSVLNIC